MSISSLVGAPQRQALASLATSAAAYEGPRGATSARFGLVAMEQSAVGLPHMPAGFHARDGVVTGLSLRGCGLTSLHDAIGDLTSLVDLDLTDNALTALPRSMERLSSLECL